MLECIPLPKEMPHDFWERYTTAYRTHAGDEAYYRGALLPQFNAILMNCLPPKVASPIKTNLDWADNTEAQQRRPAFAFWGNTKDAESSSSGLAKVKYEFPSQLEDDENESSLRQM